jgi:hypothetical protein
LTVPRATRLGFAVLLEASLVNAAGRVPGTAHRLLAHENWQRVLSSANVVQPEFAVEAFGKLMLDYLATHAKSHGSGSVRLEIGIHQHAANFDSMSRKPYEAAVGYHRDIQSARATRSEFSR